MKKVSIDKIALFLKLEKPYLLEIEKAVSKLQNGLLKIDLRVYRGFVTDVVIHRSERIVFKRKNPVDKVEK